MYVLRQNNLKAIDLKNLYPEHAPNKNRILTAWKLLRAGATSEEVRLLLGLRANLIIYSGSSGLY